MKFVVDMNLPLSLTSIFRNAGWQAVHWSEVGYPNAKDADIMAWAKDNDSAVVTLDLDFGELLALTNASAPSVIQLRATHGLKALELAPYLVQAVSSFSAEIEQGAIISIDFGASRVRMLPFKP